jgi:hypothetical protein
MSTHTDDPDYERLIVEKLKEIEADLQAVAKEGDVFDDRARNALAWLDERREAADAE